MVGQCLYCPQNTKLQRKSFIILPESSDELDEYFCGGLNREGVTCAQCKKNYSVAVNSEQFKCIPCSSDSIYYSWVFYLLAEYLPLTIMLVIVVLLTFQLLLDQLMHSYSLLRLFLLHLELIPMVASIIHLLLQQLLF